MYMHSSVQLACPGARPGNRGRHGLEPAANPESPERIKKQTIYCTGVMILCSVCSGPILSHVNTLKGMLQVSASIVSVGLLKGC